MNEETRIIFISASFDERSKKGVGCSVLLSHQECAAYSKTKPKPDFTTVDFLQTTGVTLELETAFWVLQKLPVQKNFSGLLLCTDLKTVGGLPNKRERLEKTDYVGVRPGMLVSHADLFKKFFKQQDRLGLDVIFLAGEEVEENPENKILFPVLRDVRSCSREKLRQEIREETTEKISDKWF